MSARYRDRKTFTVPLTSGEYAPEAIVFGSSNDYVAPEPILGVTAALESAPASAVLELWLPKLTGDNTPDEATGYFLYQTTTSGDTWALASYPGAMLKVKSGGTAGSAIVSAIAD